MIDLLDIIPVEKKTSKKISAIDQGPQRSGVEANAKPPQKVLPIGLPASRARALAALRPNLFLFL